jgi:hypothetical protein
MPAERHSRLVGDQIDPTWRLSGFGIFARLVRLNWLQPQDYFAAFGMRLKRADDLSRVLTFSAAYSQRLAASVRMSVPESWDIANWFPFQIEDARYDDPWVFRYCPSCLGAGFHSHLTQQPWMARCPWHGDALRTTCRVCSSPMNTSGADGRLLLQCHCGYDIFNSRAAVSTRWWNRTKASEQMEEYWTWAQRERQFTTLIGPQISRSFPKLADVAQLPRSLEQFGYDGRSGSSAHSWSATRKPRFTVFDPMADLMRFHPLASARPTVVELPQSLAPKFQRIASAMAAQLPPGALTEKEQAAFFGASSTSKPVPRRTELALTRLPCLTVGERNYLDATSLTKVATGIAYRTAVYLETSGSTADKASLGAHQLVLLTVAAILARAYAEGILKVFERWVPDFCNSVLRPRLTEPWVVLSRNAEGSLMKTRILWVGYHPEFDTLS